MIIVKNEMWIPMPKGITCEQCQDISCIEGVVNLNYGNDGLTVEKEPDAEWAELKPEIEKILEER